ncbi:hypothetical protein [Sphingomonas bacterium]|uniref:hypothetical protein n=1 Tax=Sphingomonas bacterium TaxID=1895847 RepID=UPI00261AA57F|nr:hypothetical protein [Sphingomonas bacterium]MDB5678536.1 hypothetical protein [Sphingomonas bacterium]
MERAAKATKTLPAPTPARAPVRPHPVTAAAVLQTRIGASGVRKMLAGHGQGANDKRPSEQAHHNKDDKSGHGAARGPSAHKKLGHAGSDGKEKAPALEEVGADGGAPDQAAETKVKLHIPEPPTKPSKATLGRIAGVKARAGSAAVAQRTLPDGGAQVSDAHEAVVPPTAERLAEARAKLIAQVHAAPSPDILKLCEHIREVIREKRPKDDDALTEADPTAAANEAGATLNANISSESQKVETGYKALEGNATPVPAPTTPGLTPQPAAAVTAPLNARTATPDAVPAGNVSLDKDAGDARQRADAAGMNKPAAALVQSGPVAETREAQGELDDLAKTDPGKVIAQQKEALAKADADMGALQMRALAALTGARAGTSGRATDHKKAMVGSEAQMREQAGSEAAAAIGGTQELVKAMLKEVVPTAMQQWDTAKDSLTTKFKNDLAGVEAEIKDRHSGVGGKLLAVGDWFTGLPDWVIEDYDKAEQHFADGVIDSLKKISTYVNSIINACEALIKQTRDRLDQIYGALPLSMQKWADGEKAKFNGQLDALGKEVHDTQQSFNKDLGNRAGQAVDEVREQIAELRLKAGGLVGRIVNAVKRFLDDPVKFIIEGLLELLGISPPAFWAVIAKIKKVASDIVDDPMGFANNLMAGIGQGFSQFFDNFGTHMVRGFLSWLLGDLKDVQIPKDFSPRSIITFFLQIMGITWPNIRKIIAKKIGEKNVALIEKVWSLVSVLIDKGPEGIFDMIKEKLDPQAIIDQVIQMAVDYMVTAIAKQVAIRIALLFNPAGAILQAIEAIYRVLKWVFQNAARIFTLIETIVNGLADIIAGNIGGFANAVEKGLEMLIAPVLGFIADYFSLGDLPKTVAKQIKSFQGWILGMIEAAFDWVIEKGKALLAAVGLGGKDKKKDGADEFGSIGEEVGFTAGEESHRLWIEVHGDDGVVMVASAKQRLDHFFASAPVVKALKAHKGKQLPKDVELAQKALKETDHDIDSLAKTVHSVQADQAAGKPEAKLTGKNDSVKAKERSLAVILVRIFDALKLPEPIAGEHPVTRNPKAGEEESHHVPAKSLGQVIKEFLGEAQKRCTGGIWAGDPLAEAVEEGIENALKVIGKLSDGEGPGLSAILLSHTTHKAEGGAHSSEMARALAALVTGKEKLLVARRTTERELDGFKSFISVNPQKPGWRAFLVDIHKQNEDKKHYTKPGEARHDEKIQAVDLILDKAEKQNAKLSEDVLMTDLVQPLNAVLRKAPAEAFRTGRTIVLLAMDEHEEGTPTGRRKALSDLDREFNRTWSAFMEPIIVKLP